MGFVTVGITYCNEGELLRQCLESLLIQSLPPDEIVIYDDASQNPPDQFIPEGLPVKIIRGTVNRGPAYGRNVLLDQCQSDFIHFHDADDWFHQEWCSHVRNAVSERPGVDALFTEVSSSSRGSVVTAEVIGLRRLAEDRDLLAFAIDAVLLTDCGTYRKAFLAKTGGYSTEFWQSEDYEFHIRLAAAEPSFVVLLKPLVYKRLHESCRSNDGAACWRDLVKSLVAFSGELPKRYRRRICERLGGAACALFRLGDGTAAAEALALARSLGNPTYASERAGFRTLALVIGPERAVRICNAYRTVLPHEARRWVANRGI